MELHTHTVVLNPHINRKDGSYTTIPYIYTESGRVCNVLQWAGAGAGVGVGILLPHLDHFLMAVSSSPAGPEVSVPRQHRPSLEHQERVEATVERIFQHESLWNTCSVYTLADQSLYVCMFTTDLHCCTLQAG